MSSGDQHFAPIRPEFLVASARSGASRAPPPTANTSSGSSRRGQNTPAERKKEIKKATAQYADRLKLRTTAWKSGYCADLCGFAARGTPAMFSFCRFVRHDCRRHCP